MTDPTKYRVTLMCDCKVDAVEGYGATIEEADANARRHFLDHGDRARVCERIVEHAVTTKSGASHYEEV